MAKPATYVNKSGGSVNKMAGGQAPAHPNVLVVCDDVNLDFGKVRLRSQGSAGGHHGLEDIIVHFGTEDFPRLRVGVRTGNMPHDLSGFVLEKFSKEEQTHLDSIVDRAVEVCETWVKDGFDAAQARLSVLQSNSGALDQ